MRISPGRKIFSNVQTRHRPNERRPQRLFLHWAYSDHAGSFAFLRQLSDSSLFQDVGAGFRAASGKRKVRPLHPIRKSNGSPENVDLINYELGAREGAKKEKADGGYENRLRDCGVWTRGCASGEHLPGGIIPCSLQILNSLRAGPAMTRYKVAPLSHSSNFIGSLGDQKSFRK